MRAWIRRLLIKTRAAPTLGRAYLPGDAFVSGVVVHVATRERFRIVVLRGRPEDVCDCCAVPCNWLSLEFQGDDDNWEPLLVVHEQNIVAIQAAVADAAVFLRAPVEPADQEKK